MKRIIAILAAAAVFYALTQCAAQPAVRNLRRREEQFKELGL